MPVTFKPSTVFAWMTCDAVWKAACRQRALRLMQPLLLLLLALIIAPKRCLPAPFRRVRTVLASMTACEDLQARAWSRADVACSLAAVAASVGVIVVAAEFGRCVANELMARSERRLPEVDAACRPGMTVIGDINVVAGDIYLNGRSLFEAMLQLKEEVQRLNEAHAVARRRIVALEACVCEQDALTRQMWFAPGMPGFQDARANYYDAYTRAFGGCATAAAATSRAATDAERGL